MGYSNFFGGVMCCKCDELLGWLSKEIIFLEELKNNSQKDTNHFHSVSAKIEAFKVVLGGLKE